MAGHSHWAGIKHRKGRADEKRSKIFSKLSKEITVAAKLGSKDPSMNPRLRSAIQTARAANMPKDNIERAIKKSEINKSLNYNSLTYEGFGPEKIAIIIEALTDNKNRTASNIRTLFQKFRRTGETNRDTGNWREYFKGSSFSSCSFHDFKKNRGHTFYRGRRRSRIISLYLYSGSPCVIRSSGN